MLCPTTRPTHTPSRPRADTVSYGVLHVHCSSCLEGPPLQRGGHTGEVRCKTGAVPQL